MNIIIVTLSIVILLSILLIHKIMKKTLKILEEENEN